VGEKIAPALSVPGAIPMGMGAVIGLVICDTPGVRRSFFREALTTREFQNCYSEHLVSRDLVTH
jgi:hypothetical protein